MKYLLYTLIIFLLSEISANLLPTQLSYSDSLLTQLQIEESDSAKIDRLISVSLSFNQTNPDSAAYYALQAKKISERTDNFRLKTTTANHLGRVYIRMGSYALALATFEEALNYIEQLPYKPALKAGTLRGIGNIYFIQYKYDEALSFYDEALENFRLAGDSSGVNLVYGGFANIYFETGQKELAITYYKKQLYYYIDIEDEMGLGSTYLNLGMLYDTMDSLSLAIDYSEKALTIAEKNNALVMMTYPLKILSSVSNSLENFEQGIQYGQQSLDISQELGIIYEQKDAHMNLSYSYERLGNFERALSHYKSYNELNDSLLNEDANTRLAEMRAKYETEKKEQEIVALETENNLQSARIIAVSSSLGLVITMTLIGITWFVTRKRRQISLLEKDKLIAESEKKLAHEELENSRLREENLQSELTNFALQIVEKNDFLEEVKTEMAGVRNEIKNEEALNHINKLGSRIYQNLMLNKDREEFEIQIDQVCDGFYKNLERKYPELTPQERRLAALLRLNLSSKDISGIMNISPKSVDQGRYRLRKKLALHKRKNLSQFLNQI